MSSLLEKKGYKVEVKEEKGCRLTLTVILDKEQAGRAYKEALKRVNKEISLPGFRKGKAPDEAILSRYAAPVEREWKEILVNDAFQVGLELSKIYPYSKNSVEKPKISQCSLDLGATVHITYERYPQIPEVNLKELSLPHTEKREIKEEEIKEILHELKQAHADWEEIKDRAIQEGDYVDLSIDKIDEEPPHPLIQKRRFEISSQMVAWLKSALIGRSSGEVIETQTVATDEQESIKVRVTIHAIQKILMPEVDDALAQKAGATSKEDLIKKIRSNLEGDAKMKQKEAQIILLENLLIDKYHFEIPASILQNEIKNRIEDKIAEMKQQNVTEEKINEEKSKIEESAPSHAEKSLRLHFLLSAIAERNNVYLTKEELNEKLNQEILRNPYYHNLIKENNEMLQTLIRRLSTHFQHEKIKEWMLTQLAAAA